MGRDDTIEYARERDLPITTTKSSPYSIDENLWGRSIECGILEDPWASPPDDVYEMTSSSATEPRDLEIGFEGGVPVAVDGEHLDPLAAIELVGKIVGAYEFGCIDMVVARLVWIKETGRAS